MTRPSAPVGDGRSPSGRFAPGNKHGRGNPHAKAATDDSPKSMAAVAMATSKWLLAPIIALKAASEYRS